MNAHLKLSAAGANLIKHSLRDALKKSGDRFRAYKCPANVLTPVSATPATTGEIFDASSRWTLQECHDAFLEDMGTFERACTPPRQSASRCHQYDALVSFCYNCGEGNLAKSTLLKKVNASDFEGAALEFHRWNKGGGKVLAGLTRRRASEALLFQNIADENYDGKPDKVVRRFHIPEPMPQLGRRRR